jgi:hypothetical protein
MLSSSDNNDSLVVWVVWSFASIVGASSVVASSFGDCSSFEFPVNWESQDDAVVVVRHKIGQEHFHIGVVCYKAQLRVMEERFRIEVAAHTDEQATAD